MTKYEILISEILCELEKQGRYLSQKDFIQHGDTTTYEHSIQVAKMSCYLADKYEIDVDYSSMIRGALLHDYFLYDWHDKEKNCSWHGFTHPHAALKNAKKDYKINLVEENIILRHMFPLTVIPPANKEAWLVCMSDKLCAFNETAIAIKMRSAVLKVKGLLVP